MGKVWSLQNIAGSYFATNISTDPRRRRCHSRSYERRQRLRHLPRPPPHHATRFMAAPPSRTHKTHKPSGSSRQAAQVLLLLLRSILLRASPPRHRQASAPPPCDSLRSRAQDVLEARTARHQPKTVRRRCDAMAQPHGYVCICWCDDGSDVDISE